MERTCIPVKGKRERPRWCRERDAAGGARHRWWILQGIGWAVCRGPRKESLLRILVQTANTTTAYGILLLPLSRHGPSP